VLSENSSLTVLELEGNKLNNEQVRRLLKSSSIELLNLRRFDDSDDPKISLIRSVFQISRIIILSKNYI